MIVFFKSIFSVAMSRYILLFFTLLSSVIIARVLGPERQGEVVKLLFLPQIIASLISLNVPEQFLCYWSSREDSLRNNTRCISLFLGLYAVLLIVGFGAYFLW